MGKIEALELIKKTWDDKELSLGDKIINISEAYYSVELDIATVANFIKATPALFDTFLSLSNLDEDMIWRVSEVNPPKTTWPLLASGNNDEIEKALAAWSSLQKPKNEPVSEFFYQKMLEVAGETPEKLISQLTVDELFYLGKKATNYNSISQNKVSAINSMAGQKKRGKKLSDRQITYLIDILKDMADNNVIKRDSVDDDKDLCDKILNALGR